MFFYGNCSFSTFKCSACPPNEDDTGDFYDGKLGYEDLFKQAKELRAEAGSEFDTVGGCALVYWFVGVFSGWNAIF